jgi:transposase
VLLSNRMDWSAEQIVAGYGGQQSIERVFRGLKDGRQANAQVDPSVSEGRSDGGRVGKSGG